VVAFDNLKRRGSELAIERLRRCGVEFHHGDVRCADDLEAAGPADLLIECSAEPSVHAGYQDGPHYLIATNLGGYRETASSICAAMAATCCSCPPAASTRSADCAPSHSSGRAIASPCRPARRAAAGRPRPASANPFRSAAADRCTARPSSLPNC